MSNNALFSHTQICRELRNNLIDVGLKNFMSQKVSFVDI